MKSTELLALKNNTLYQTLDDNVITSILDSLNQSNIKSFKISKKQINVLKNNKIQNKKDLNENKLIRIMNKLSHNNCNELIKEYLLTITIIDITEYNMIIHEIIIKLINDIKFIDNYIPFIIKLFSIEKYRLGYEPTYFIETINTIINDIYINMVDNMNNIITFDNEANRSAFLLLINKLIKYNFFNNEMYSYISYGLLNQHRYVIDIYNWFNYINNDISIISYHNKIKEYIMYCIKNNMKREQLMLENLIDSTSKSTNTINNVNTIINNIKHVDNTDELFLVSTNNIIEEYLYLELIEEVVNYCNNECNTIQYKNLFCRELIKSYLQASTIKQLSILTLFNNLIKSRVLFKSNISKGLMMYLDVNTPSDNIILFLKYLKNNNITKNIEHVFKKYKIKINVITN